MRLASILCPDLDYNAIHINHNVTCPPHKDDKNTGIIWGLHWFSYYC